MNCCERDASRLLLRRSVTEVLVTQVCKGKIYQHQSHNVAQNNEEQQLQLESRSSAVQAQYAKHSSAANTKPSDGNNGGHWPGLGLGL